VALLSATLTVVDDASDFHVRDGGLAHLEPVADLCVTGEVRIHIDRTFTLEELPAALARVGEGRALGKVVVCPS
jgi:NADPH:quinone reductase-like Zn-dependent oxidoreductase